MLADGKEKNGGGFKDKVRCILILALGMLVLFWRVVIPSITGVTIGIGTLIMMLDLILTITVVVLSKKEWKEALARKYTWKTAAKTLLAAVILFIVQVIVVQGIILPIFELEFSAGADAVAAEYLVIFPVGAVFSMVIAAPLWEETVFRMAGRNLIGNRLLFVVVTSLLFAFIHTVNLSVADNLLYFAGGLVLSITYLLSEDILISMGAHFLVNLLSIVLHFSLAD